MPGCCPAVATFAFHCPTVLLYPVHLPLLYRKAILEPAKFSNVDLFLIPLPVITSCRSYLMYLRQPDVTDGDTEIASTSTKIKCFNYFAWVKPLRALSLLALEFATSPDQTCWLVPTCLLQLFGAVDIPVSGMEGSDSALPFPQKWWPSDFSIKNIFLGSQHTENVAVGEQEVFTVSAELEAMTWFYSVWEKSTHRMRRIYLIIGLGFFK